jgi:hypothetical protein
LYGGYFCGWYLLLGLGYARWLTENPDNRASWAIVAFGAGAYFLLIPSLLLGGIPALEQLSVRSAAAIREGFARRAVGRRHAFAVGLVGSLVAMATCAVGWGAAALSDDWLSTEKLGEDGVAVVIVGMMMGTVAVIAVCPWLGQRLLLMKCRPREPGVRRSWSAVLVPVAAMAWVVLVGWLGYRLVNATSVMTARLDYTTLPASDEQLQERLRSQPGLTAVVGREGNTVVVECRVSAFRSHAFSRWGDTVVLEYVTPGGEKRTLELTHAAAESGYDGLRSAEFDKPRRRW